MEDRSVVTRFIPLSFGTFELLIILTIHINFYTLYRAYIN